MELQSAVRAGSVVTNKMVVGKSVSPDKSNNPSGAEMRSAFEAMMGALLGMLGAAEQMAAVDTPADGGPSTGNLANVSDLLDGLSADGLPTLLDDKATPAVDGQTGQASTPASEGQEATPGDAAGSKSATTQNASPDTTPTPSQEAPTSSADSPVVKEGQAVAQVSAQASSSAIQQLAAEMDGANSEKSGQKFSPQPAPTTKGDSNSPLSGMGFTVNSTAAPGSTAAPLKSDAPLPATPAEQISERVQVSFNRGEQDASIQVKEGQALPLAPADASPLTIQQLTAEMEGATTDQSGQESYKQPADQTKNDSNSTVSAMGLSVNNTAAPSSEVMTPKSHSPVIATPAEQIGEQVQVSFNRGEQDATIQLHPKELGSVRIRLQMENGQLHLSIQADQQETGRLLNSKLADLRQSLEGQGIKVGDLAVARSERTLSTQTANQPIASATHSGQMDMNPNDSQPQRQQMAFAGRNFGNETFAGGQNAHRQQAGLHSSIPTSGDVLPVAEHPLTYSVARGPAGVDYYV